MRKLVGKGILTLSMVFAAYAHDDEHTHAEISSLQAQQATLAQQIANLEAQLTSVTQATAPAAAAAPTATPAFPRIRQSGSVSMTPRMELDRRTDVQGNEQTLLRDVNRRRLIFGWSYRLDINVNEQIDFTFRFADPDDGTTILGSGQGERIGDALVPVLPNAFFTWKAADKFRLSGGLLNVPSNAALEIHSSYVTESPTNTWGNTFHSSLAGFNFALPLSSEFNAFVTAGIANAPYARDAQVKRATTTSADTVASYNDGRIIVGANLTLAEKKVTLRPTLNIITTGDFVRNVDATAETPVMDTILSRGAQVSYGLDMGFRLADQFTLNADFAGLSHNSEHPTNREVSMFRIGAEPIVTFGGENNRLFTARVRYAVDILNNNHESCNANDESAIVHFVDARLTCASRA
jgi:hypothetical protein